jgi:hypothetical protein
MDKARAGSTQHVKELIDMELVADYMAILDYTMKWNNMMKDDGYGIFLRVMEDPCRSTTVVLPSYRETDVRNLIKGYG